MADGSASEGWAELCSLVLGFRSRTGPSAVGKGSGGEDMIAVVCYNCNADSEAIACRELI